VRVEASRLRAKLREYYEGEGANDPVRIQIPKGSYVPLFESTRSEKRSHPWMLWAAAALVIAISILSWKWPSRTRAIESIAVLPFSDLSEKKDAAAAAAGLTEQIEDELTRLRDLRVIGATTSKQAASNPDLRAAAKQIGADALLTGSIRAEEKKVRIAVRLYEGRTGESIWSGSFDGDRGDLLALEDQIARAVAGKLEIQLAVLRQGVDPRLAPQRAQSHEYYEQARAIVSRDSARPLDDAFRLFQLAIATDPTYAAPHAALSSLLTMTGGEKAMEEWKTALQLDPGLPSAHAARILYYRDAELDWKKARAMCAESLQKYPNAALIVAQCAAVEGVLGEHKNEVDLMRRAVMLDPLNARMHSGLMIALYRAGQFDEALSEVETTLRLGPPSYAVYRHKALLLAAKGDLEAGLRVIDEARTRLEGVPEDWMTVRGYILGRLNRRDEAGRLARDYPQSPDLNVGIIYLGMNDRDRALEYFRKALTTQRVALTHAIPEYYSRVLDGDPRFESIKKELGLVSN
jgi:TolB-like protein/Flp pilus assembly protein TadD